MAKELRFDGRFVNIQGRLDANFVEFDPTDKRLDTGLIGNRKHAGLGFRFKHDKIREIPFDVMDDVEVIVTDERKVKVLDDELLLEGKFDFQGRLDGNIVAFEDSRLSGWFDNL